MNSLTRHLQAYPNPPATHVEALEQVLAAHAGEPENEFAITATSGVYGQGIRTGLTWGHLRALLAELNPAEPAPGRHSPSRDRTSPRPVRRGTPAAHARSGRDPPTPDEEPPCRPPAPPAPSSPADRPP